MTETFIQGETSITKESIILFTHPMYKTNFEKAVLLEQALLINRKVVRVNYSLIMAEIFGLADKLTEEWIHRENLIMVDDENTNI